MKRVTTFLLYGLLTGCGVLGATSALTNLVKPDSGVSVEAQVGKENTQQVVGQQNETTNNAGGDINTTEIINQNVSAVMLILCILGWILPTPQSIGKWVWNKFTRKTK